MPLSCGEVALHQVTMLQTCLYASLLCDLASYFIPLVLSFLSGSGKDVMSSCVRRLGPVLEDPKVLACLIAPAASSPQGGTGRWFPRHATLQRAVIGSFPRGSCGPEDISRAQELENRAKASLLAGPKG